MSKKIFICDVDGVLTDGKHIYTEKGKTAKAFGSSDRDAIEMAMYYGYDFLFLTADKSGFEITKKRIIEIYSPHLQPPKWELKQVSGMEKYNYIEKNIVPNYDDITYCADDIFDIYTFVRLEKINKKVFTACPHNSIDQLKDVAMMISARNGGEYFLADVILNVLIIELRKTAFEIIEEYINSRIELKDTHLRI